MKNIKRKIGMALAAIGLTTGIVIGGSVPAQAVSVSSVNYCAWPLKSGYDLVGDSSSYGYSWTAYSPTGYKLGTHWGQNWYTPWEDTSVWVSSNDPSFYIVTFCY